MVMTTTVKTAHYKASVTWNVLSPARDEWFKGIMNELCKRIPELFEPCIPADAKDKSGQIFVFQMTLTDERKTRLTATNDAAMAIGRFLLRILESSLMPLSTQDTAFTQFLLRLEVESVVPPAGASRARYPLGHCR